MRNASDKSCTEYQNTHFVLHNPFPKNRTVYEIMWKIIVQPDRPQMTILRLRAACWITKATDTHSECVILIAFPRQHWLRERSSMLRLYIQYLSRYNRYGVCLLRGTN